MKVKATNNYEKLKLKDKKLNRIPKEGEVFEVSEERYDYLTSGNEYKVAFVEKIEDEKKIETATKKVKKETAVKKTK